MAAIMSPTRIWSDPEIRKVASLLGIIRDIEELAKGAAAMDDLELARDYADVRTDALSTLRALVADDGLGMPEHAEDELEATHPGIRKPPGAAKK